ncbi:hypothetical protein [Microbacterium sp. G2-8]|uniref:maltokinase N-terminal cap-like domain-containing protein n=1 Tax=Microbacterium sp. G2-8 TaxID=2842454 RepID=UPI001C88F91A|nr:hypothetical protein [Microbacterium sp. G2-8]
MTPLVPDAFEGYLVRTRWFGGKGRPFRVTGVRTIAEMGSADPGPAVIVHLVDVAYDDDEGGEDTYQVPLAYYADPVDRLGHAFVGAWDDAVFGGVELGSTWAYDAVHDRDAMHVWFEAFADAGVDGSLAVPGAVFQRTRVDVELDLDAASSPLAGEQSNSSIRFGEQAIMKLFRKVTPGHNPDIEIHRALTEAGNDFVAELYGWIDADGDEGSVRQLGMLQHFLRTATDGFDLSMASVRAMLADDIDGAASYAGEARELGRAVARIHQDLRDLFPYEDRDALAAGALADLMRDRLDQAILAVPELDSHAPRLRGLFARVGELKTLGAQRIHGDLHLGQALRTVHGWKIVDFEGEPAKPLAVRSRPDSVWRDVAGMLRSFDYAPAVVSMAPADTDDAGERRELCERWGIAARGAFLSAYAEECGLPEGRVAGDDLLLLDAFVADKAVYEAVYEKRNRPTWIGIPLAAIARLGDPEETA